MRENNLPLFFCFRLEGVEQPLGECCKLNPITRSHCLDTLKGHVQQSEPLGNLTPDGSSTLA
jgi:hypothetical protein